MKDSSADKLFICWLRQALHHLYDPVKLRNNLLFRSFDLDKKRSPSSMRKILVDAIESLKPARGLSPQSDAWRTYYTLSHRFVDQFAQSEVAANLGLSIRQLRRQEKLALQALADYLWSQYDLPSKFSELRLALDEEGRSVDLEETETASQKQELEWLEKSLPSEPTDVIQMIQTVLKVVSPMLDESKIHVECSIPDHMPSLAVQSTAVRQALLNILTAAIHSIPQGQIQVKVESHSGQAWVWVRPIKTESTGSGPLTNGQNENLEMARQLVGLSGGSLEIEFEPEAACPFIARVSLPVAGQETVVVIEDNHDTLQLFLRYLAGSRYLFVGTRDPGQALELAERLSPKVIILDVMLPGIDGWELLGRLREHPRTRKTPIIICTILPQEQLALTLGAAAFLRKPFNRKELLETLDRQVDLTAQEFE